MDLRERIANGLTEDLQIARASARVMFHLRERLAILRHQVFAHRGWGSDNVDADELIVSNNIDESDFLGLIAGAQNILARHLGRPLTKQLDVEGRDAVGELVDLDVYLNDAIRGRWGIEPLYTELDGQPHAAPVRVG